jgi:predicted RNA-binding Zn-ribbon protein involved in translation (DUF1610 family)
MEEKVFFEYEGVRVTNTRFVVDGQTFAMNNVTSVKPFEKRPSRVGPVILIVLGVLSALGGGYLGVAARSCQTLGVAISISPNMDPHQNMPCPNCGVQILPKAAFCHACGRQLSARESDAPANKAVPEEERQEIAPRSQPSPQPAFRGLRILNWIIVALLVPGAALMLLRSSQPTGVVLGLTQK